MSDFIGDWHALVILLVAGVIPNQIWRMLGLWFGGGIDEGSELLIWVRAVATAILAGVIAEIVVQPPGALASVPDVAALCVWSRRICRLHGLAEIDFRRRGVRRDRDRGGQMVARLTSGRRLAILARMQRTIDWIETWFGKVKSGTAKSPSKCRRPRDAGLVFIGRIRTPWTSRLATPRQGRHDGPVCRLEIFEPWVAALKGVDFYSQPRGALLAAPVAPRHRAAIAEEQQTTRGTFSLRSPVRPNPIGTSIVKLVGVEGSALLVRGLDCLDGTPLIDLKPDRCEFTPLAPPQAGDFETE